MGPDTAKRGFVEVTMLNGETKKLRFTANALIAAEEHLNKSVWAILQHPETIGFRELRALLWAGMSGAGSPWKMDAVAKQMNLKEIGNYTNAVLRAISTAMGIDPDKVEVESDEDADPTEIPATSAEG